MQGFIVTFVTLLLQILSYLILGRVLLSWIDPTGNMRITQILRELTEPILGPIRSLIPSIGMIDISPIVAFLLISLLQRLIVSAL
jgi:YggT family protein